MSTICCEVSNFDVFIKMLYMRIKCFYDAKINGLWNVTMQCDVTTIFLLNEVKFLKKEMTWYKSIHEVIESFQMFNSRKLSCKFRFIPSLRIMLTVFAQAYANRRVLWRIRELISVGTRPKIECCTCSRVLTNVSVVCISQCKHKKHLLFLL